MSYTFRRILHLSNLILILGSMAISVYSIVMLFILPEEWPFLLLLLGIGIVSGLFFLVIYGVRKSKFPFPGIDYK